MGRDLENLTAINALESVEVTNKLLSLGLTELGIMLDEISFLTTLTKYRKDRATLDTMKSKIEGVLHRATIQFNGVTNESLLNL
jgi:heme/copper-type cytochrome/quinol oxidase subunit 1